jgi:hypothetical protein
MRFKGSKAIEEFWSFLENESPRCVSIVVAAYFDERLRALLGKKKGDFDERINRALKENILTNDEHPDLHTIRDLRNKFAHELRESDFDHAKSKQVNELRIWKKATEDIPYRARVSFNRQGTNSLRCGSTLWKAQEGSHEIQRAIV